MGGYGDLLPSSLQFLPDSYVGLYVPASPKSGDN